MLKSNGSEAGLPHAEEITADKETAPVVIRDRRLNTTAKHSNIAVGLPDRLEPYGLARLMELVPVSVRDWNTKHQGSYPLGCVHRAEVCVAHPAGCVEIAERDGSAIVPLSFRLLYIGVVFTMQCASQRRRFE